MSQNNQQKQQEFGPDGGGRIKGLTVVKPIVYGNYARYFGKKREEDGHTHEWTVYVKPYHNEDMSTYVKKVTIYHILKLFQSGMIGPPSVMPGEYKQVLVSECLDELLFQDPSALMEQLLTNSRPLTIGQYTHDTDFELKKEETLKQISGAQEKINTEIADLRHKIKLAKSTINIFKDKISRAQNLASAEAS